LFWCCRYHVASISFVSASKRSMIEIKKVSQQGVQ
jgi:hypothetical protein